MVKDHAPVRVITIAKKDYVGNLYWQSLARPRELKAEARELAVKNECDLFIVRSVDGIAQTGLVSTVAGFRAGQISLAAAVATGVHEQGLVIDGQRKQVPTWCGAFNLGDDQWAYIAVRDNAVMPAGDVIGTRDHVIDLLEQNYGLGGWNAVVGAEEVAPGFHNFVVARVEDLLPKNKKGAIKVDAVTVLKPIKFKISKKAMMLCVGGAAVCALGYTGYSQWRQAVEEREGREAMERVRAEMAANKRQVVLSAEEMKPWIAQPLPLDLTEACEAGLANFAPGGWILKEFSCDQSAMHSSFDRGTSVISWLLEVLPDARVDASGNKATITRPLKFAQRSDDSLARSDAIVIPFIDASQRLGVKASITEELPPPPKETLPGASLLKQEEPPRPDWKKFKIEVGPTTLRPAVVAEYLIKPGMRISQISYQNGNWAFTGVIYAR